jgi:hypothetical protein
MRLTLRAQSFGPLAKVEWTVPPGVSAIVGPNRVGKSTLLALPKFIRIAIHDGLNEAVRAVFDGPGFVRNWGLPVTSPCGVGMAAGQADWDVDIAISGGSITPFGAERLSWRDDVVFTRSHGSAEAENQGRSIVVESRLLPGVCLERKLLKMESPIDSAALVAGVKLASCAADFSAYRTYEYEIQHLVKFGSVQFDGIVLQQAGTNVFPLLRNWRDNSDTEARFEFVMSTLREAFPHIGKMNFDQAGQTVTMGLRDQRWPDVKVPISRESTGVISALLQLCAVASTPERGLVTLDEIETSLHPHAIRVLIAAFRRWAKEHDLRIVLATQSETVLDQFHDDPSQIYVIEPNQETSPRSLTDLFDGEYLSQFSLGDLFSHLEFGSNREPASP